MSETTILNEQSENKPVQPEPQKPGRNWKRATLVTLASIIVLAAGVASYSKYFSKTVEDKPVVFAAVEATPSGEGVNLESSIDIQFSHAVSAHHIQDYVEITPKLNGKIAQGSDQTRITFKPEGPLPPATIITVLLKAGLPSDTGQKLIADYFFTFTTKSLDDTITFSEGGQSAKFMSFHADRGVDLDITVGEEVKNPKARIYKVSSIDTLLKSFTYDSDDYDGRYSLFNTYKEQAVDTSKLVLVKEIANVADIKNFHFKEAPGLYILEARDGDKLLNTAWISLSNIGIHFRQDDEKVTLAAQNLATGKPEDGVQATFYSLEEKPTTIEKHTINGLDEYSFPFSKVIDLVVAEKGPDIMVVPVNVPNSQAEIRVYDDLNTSKLIFMYTDRPIYRPGQKVYFRGLVRIDEDALYRVPPKGTKIKIFTPQYQDNKVDIIATTDSDGSFYGEFTLPDAPVIGSQYNTLYATADITDDKGYSNSSASFEVTQYQKPDFGITSSIEKEEYTKGDTVTATIVGKYFTGKAMAGEKVTYRVFQRDFYETERAAYNKSFRLSGWGGMCGAGGFGEIYGEEYLTAKEITLDKNGRAKIQIKTNDLRTPYSKEVVVVAQKKDQYDNEITGGASTIVHAGEFNLFFRPNQNAQVKGAPYSYTVYAENLVGGKIVNQPLDYEIIELTYSNDGKQNRKSLGKKTTTTNAEGVANVSGILPKPDAYPSLLFVVSAKDKRGNTIEVNDYINLQNEVNKFRVNGAFGRYDPNNTVH